MMFDLCYESIFALPVIGDSFWKYSFALIVLSWILFLENLMLECFNIQKLSKLAGIKAKQNWRF